MRHGDANEQRRGAAWSAAAWPRPSAVRASATVSATTAGVETGEKRAHTQQERRGRRPQALAPHAASPPLPPAAPSQPAGAGRQQHSARAPALQRAERDLSGVRAPLVPLGAQTAAGLAGTSHGGGSGLRDLVQRQAALARVAGKMKSLELSLPAAPMPASSAAPPHRQYPVMVPAFARRVVHGN